jgi:hypothetical protein
VYHACASMPTFMYVCLGACICILHVCLTECMCTMRVYVGVSHTNTHT